MRTEAHPHASRPAALRRFGIAVTPLFFLLMTANSGRVRAEVVIYKPVTAANRTASVHIGVPYTFGTHQFEVRDVNGEIRVDWEKLPLISGRLMVPLAALRGGGETLGCHMRESLGLDYATSAFPGEHVCSGGKLPSSGKDAVAFPEISFEIRRSAVLGGQARPGPNQSLRIAVWGRWTIHGVGRDDSFELVVTAVEGGARYPRVVRVEGSRKIRLTDHGVKVKRALVITEGEEATVDIDLVLAVSR